MFQFKIKYELRLFTWKFQKWQQIKGILSFFSFLDIEFSTLLIRILIQFIPKTLQIILTFPPILPTTY